MSTARQNTPAGAPSASLRHTRRVLHYLGSLVALVLAALITRSGLVFFLPLALLPLFASASLARRLDPRGEQSEDWIVLQDLEAAWLGLRRRLQRELEHIG